MRYLVFLLLATATLSAASEDEGSKQSCEPGKSFKKYCNTCVCSDDGRYSACTKRMCSPGMYNEDGSINVDDDYFDLLREKRDIDGSIKTCEPGKWFPRYCNSCICSSDGRTAACTKKTCSPGLYNEDGSVNVDGDYVDLLREKRESDGKVKVCEPGKSFKKYCNSCQCSDDGTYAACSYVECPPGMFNEDGTRNDLADSRFKREVEKPKICQPGHTFKRFCNTCQCLSDGTGYTCTSKACANGQLNMNGSRDYQHSYWSMTRRKRESNNDNLAVKVCEPGKIFKKYCNSCRCSTDGTLSVCTFMECIPDEYNEDGSLRNVHGDKSQSKNMEN